MNNNAFNKPTDELNKILKSASLKEFGKLREETIPEKLPSLSEYFNSYIGSHNLVTADVVRNSLLSRDYAYSILNGTKANPNRDRVIALCLAMHMNLTETQRALEISNAGILYAKNPRDAAIILNINNQKFDIMAINEFLSENDLELLQTSKN